MCAIVLAYPKDFNHCQRTAYQACSQPEECKREVTFWTNLIVRSLRECLGILAPEDQELTSSWTVRCEGTYTTKTQRLELDKSYPKC